MFLHLSMQKNTIVVKAHSPRKEDEKKNKKNKLHDGSLKG